MANDKIGRPVRVVSISFINKRLDDISNIVDEEGSKGADIIALPEAWRGEKLEPLNGETIQRMSYLAQKK